MIVYLILAAAGVAFSLAVLAAIVWALTRPSDRIQMAGLCLFGCIALYGAGAVQLHDADAMLGILAGAYALVLYGVLAAFAVFQQRWAWKATKGNAPGHDGIHRVRGVGEAALMKRKSPA